MTNSKELRFHPRPALRAQWLGWVFLRNKRRKPAVCFNAQHKKEGSSSLGKIGLYIPQQRAVPSLAPMVSPTLDKRNPKRRVARRGTVEMAMERIRRGT